MFTYTFSLVPFADTDLTNPLDSQRLKVDIEFQKTKRTVITDIVCTAKAFEVFTNLRSTKSHDQHPLESTRAYLIYLFDIMLDKTLGDLYVKNKHFKPTNLDRLIDEAVLEIKYLANYHFSMPDTLIDDLVEYSKFITNSIVKFNFNYHILSYLSLVKLLVIYMEVNNIILDYPNIHSHIKRIWKLGSKFDFDEEDLDEMLDNQLGKLMEWAVEQGHFVTGMNC